MKYSISTCSFYTYRIRKLLSLPKELGVEIFYEFGSDDMWTDFMTRLNADGRHAFSIHAPFAFVDIAARCDETKLFDKLKKPFDLYHRFDGEFYVLHCYGDEALCGSEAERDYSRKLATQRLAAFNDICKAEGIILGAENLCSGKAPLFDQQHFLELFRNVPDISCVIDVGHALVSGMDISALQQKLGSRICAYHLHNNDGIHDLHNRLGSGICNWSSFAENCRTFTPDAAGVLEYMDETDLGAFQEDIVFLESLMKTFKGD